MSPQTPTIAIHLVQDEVDESELEIQPLRSPYSPKFPSPMAYADSDADDFRPIHLLPPPTLSPISRPKPAAVLPTDKKGIDQERFAELLKSSRERATMKHGRKESLELRKQVTLKAHTNKALERRALFLSRIQSPPSPSSADSPATPPETPAIFHFTLPSPGLQSPLAVFEKLSKADSNTVDFPCDPTSKEVPCKGWVEEVDFKARVRSNSIRGGTTPAELDLAVSRSPRHARRASARGLPSLDQITARLAKTGSLHASSEVNPNMSAVGGLNNGTEEIGMSRPRLNLPIRKCTPSSTHATGAAESVITKEQTKATSVAARPVASSRLPPFLQKRTVAETAPAVVVTAPLVNPDPQKVPSVVVSSTPSIRRRPSIIPPPLNSSQPFTVRPMTTRLPFHPSAPAATAETRKQRGQDMVEKLRRRSSAPASLPAETKNAHLVLSLKGGF